jgi:hypothetical protein
VNKKSRLSLLFHVFLTKNETIKYLRLRFGTFNPGLVISASVDIRAKKML